ncbi:MAG: DEAD/DEAH box helicase, partial [Lachnospiraceae bacterium]
MSNQESIYSLKGIGEKTGKLYEKLGISTVEELLHYYPRAYDTFEEPAAINQLKPDCVAAVMGMLQKDASVSRFSQIQVTTAVLQDPTGTIQLTWYNMPYLRATLKPGNRFVFRGKVVQKGKRLIMEQPEIFSPDSYGEITNSMQPVYGQTKGLRNKAITKAVLQAMEERTMEREFLPASMRKTYQLAEYNYAIEHIHFPKDRQELLFARKRLVFDEFFFFILSIRKLKEKRTDAESPYPISLSSEVERLKGELPYALTAPQEQVLKEIYGDLESGLVMNRLIQGDVGSGKTIVAVLALLQAAYNGYQGALMAPTEVLAKQHFEFLTELFAAHDIKKEVVLITGSMTAKEKRMAYERISSGQAQI